jgi:hypothetical protein
MTEWWEQPYEGGKMVELPGFPRPLHPADAAEQGEAPSIDGTDVIAYKRTVARLGRWEWNPDGWDDSYSNTFAHGETGGNVGESGIAGVQRQANISPATGWLDEKTFNLLRSVKIPEGLPHAGEHAMDAVAKDLLVAAWEAAARLEEGQDEAQDGAQGGGSLKDLRVAPTPGDPNWGGSNDVMQQWVEAFMVKRGLPLGSGKRTPAENGACGGSPTSDHLTTKTTTAARDFPTRTGEDHARALAASMGCADWQPNSFANFTFSAGGRSWSAQILWGAAIDHDDHVHVGISPA